LTGTRDAGTTEARVAALLPQTAEDFPDLGTGLARAANDAIEWLVREAGWLFDAIGRGLVGTRGAPGTPADNPGPLLLLEDLLLNAPPWAVILAIGLIALAASRRPLFAIATILAAWLIGALQLWEPAMQTVALILVAILIAVLTGIPIGVLIAGSNRAKAIVAPVLDLMQTIPSFVYLLPAAMLFGLGKVPALLATVIYATPPLIRLTDLGIRGVGHEMTEASRSFGGTRLQILRGVQLPLAMPSILQGLNQTTMAALAMVVIASMIGARGVGETVLIGLQRGDFGLGLVGGVVIVLLAIIFDRVTQAAGLRGQAQRRLQG
jgi:glycine betaine/proline transport system permease protein